MGQTDRQTDKSPSATHWKSAIFDVSGSDNWAKLKNLPDFVKQVHQKLEICPTTQNPHYQIHVECHRQVRLKQMTTWIKQTKWDFVLGAEHIRNSINYISKVATTAPGAITQVVKGEKYYQIHELLLVIGRSYCPILYSELDMMMSANVKKFEEQYLFKNASRELVSRDLRWMDKISNPVIEKSWNYYYREILEQVSLELESSFIIEEDTPFFPLEYMFVD